MTCGVHLKVSMWVIGRPAAAMLGADPVPVSNDLLLLYLILTRAMHCSDELILRSVLLKPSDNTRSSESELNTCILVAHMRAS